MLLEVLGFVGIIIIVLVYLAEQKKPVLGFFASALLIILAYWVWGEGIQIESGTSATISFTMQQDQNQTASTDNVTNITTTSLTGAYNATGGLQAVPDYTSISPTSFSLQNLLGFFLAALGLYGIVHYATVRYT